MEEEKKYVDVLPLNKGKRMLVYLADLFLNFILSFLLINVAVMPIAKAVSNYTYKTALYNENVEIMHDILYGNKLVFVSPDYTKTEINPNIEYTFDCWLSYYVIDGEVSPHAKYPQYGHKIENEVVSHYYKDIKGDVAPYVTLFNHYNENDHYFDESGGQFTLKSINKAAVLPYFDEKDELTEEGKNIYNNIKSNVFMPLFSEVFTEINKNDLSYDGHSYLKSQSIVTTVNTYRDHLLYYTVFITFVLSWGIYYLLIPLLNKNRKTLSMMMMRVERINVSRLYICKRGEAAISALYQLIANLFIVFFLPLTFVSFSYLFSLNVLFSFVMLSLVFNIVSMFFILFNSFNRSLSDIFSRSVMITTDKLDEIYRAKGYNV